MTTKGDELAPLRGLLNAIVARLDAVESKVGIVPSAAATATPSVSDEGLAESVKAYEAHIENFVKPFCKSCDELTELKDISDPILNAFVGIGHIIEMASLCPKPQNVTALQTALQPFLKPTQESISKVQKYRLSRDYDWHYKAISEMMLICSWVVVTSPPPGTFVRESIGSCDYWCNKIRKQYKGDESKKAHINFCDAMKKMILELVSYCKEYHLSGLSFNPHGKFKTLQEAEAYLKDAGSKTESAAAVAPKQEDVGASLKDELMARLSGDSAAAGLNKVARDQQTWRKEYKKPEEAGTVSTPQPKAAPKPTSATKAPPRRKPVLEFNEIKQKWIVEHQTSSLSPNESTNLNIEVTDPKQQVYIYKCSDVTIQIKNKLNTIVFDSCTKCNLVFDTAISSCEIVNCKQVQIQTLGLCPSFTIDKTDSCLIYLSSETKLMSTFVTSKSTEMNVSYPDSNGEMKEVPIPEQFFHKLGDDGSISTRVSDLYH